MPDDVRDQLDAPRETKEVQRLDVRDERRREVERETAREIAAEDDRYEPEDIEVSVENSEIQADVTEDARREQARDQIAEQRDDLEPGDIGRVEFGDDETSFELTEDARRDRVQQQVASENEILKPEDIDVEFGDDGDPSVDIDPEAEMQMAREQLEEEHPDADIEVSREDGEIQAEVDEQRESRVGRALESASESWESGASKIGGAAETVAPESTYYVTTVPGVAVETPPVDDIIGQGTESGLKAVDPAGGALAAGDAAQWAGRETSGMMDAKLEAATDLAEMGVEGVQANPRKATALSLEAGSMVPPAHTWERGQAGTAVAKSGLSSSAESVGQNPGMGIAKGVGTGVGSVVVPSATATAGTRLIRAAPTPGVRTQRMFRSTDRGKMELTVTREKAQSTRSVDDDLTPKQRAEDDLPPREAFSSDAEFHRERQRAILSERAEEQLPSRDQFVSPEGYRREQQMMAERIAEEEGIRIGDPSAQQARERIPSRDRFESEEAYRRAYEDAREEPVSADLDGGTTDEMIASVADDTAGSGDEMAEATLATDPDEPFETTVVAAGQNPGNGMEDRSLDVDPDGSAEGIAVATGQYPGDGMAESELRTELESDGFAAAATEDVVDQQSETATYLDDDLQSGFGSDDAMATGFNDRFQTAFGSDEMMDSEQAMDSVMSSREAAIEAEAQMEMMDTEQAMREATRSMPREPTRARFRRPDLSDDDGGSNANTGSFELEDTSWETGFLQPEDVFDEDTDTGWWG